MRKIINYLLCFVFTFFLGMNAIGQVLEHNTKIKDGSVSSNSTPTSNAVLELESTKKGFLLPRMNNAERDAIPLKDREDGHGLTIYNIETNCVNYWSKPTNSWMSLCGTMPPAVILITNVVSCGDIVFRSADKSDRLKQGQYLTPEDAVYVTVKVTKIGTYDISAITDNGYYFSVQGSFMNTGDIRVALKGSGIPVNGYTGANTGDKVNFYSNGKLLGDICPNFKIPVDKDGTQFVTNCGAGFNALGNYFIGVPVDPTNNYVNILVNITAIGNYKISTDVVSGVSFSGSGTFDKIENNKVVQLYAEGMPTTAGTFKANTKTNSNGAASAACSISVMVKGVDYKVDLTKSTNKGEYIKGKKLVPTNTITIEVEVLSPGKTDFELKVGNVIFTAKDVILNYTAGASNKQYVTLANNSALLPSDTNKLTFVGTGKYTGSYSIDLLTPAVDYVLDCSSIAVNTDALYVPKIAVGADHYVTVKVNVTTPGVYKISTSKINGVSFEANGTFDKVENGKVVKLMAVGTPVAERTNLQYVLQTNSLSDAKNKCTFSINVNYPIRNLNIMFIGKEEYGPSYPAGGAYRLLNNPDNFGPTGTVRTNKLNVVRYNEELIISTSSGNKLTAALRDQNIDILIIAQTGRISSDAKLSLTEYMDKGGVVVASGHNDIFLGNGLLQIIEPKVIGTFTSTFSDKGNVTFTSELELGQTKFGSLRGKKITNEPNKYMYLNNFNKTYFETVVPYPGPYEGAFILKHKTKGFIYIGYGGWMTSVLGRKTIGPLKATMDGRPEQNLYNGDRTDNALFFLRIMEWAINYSLDNKKK